MLHILKINLMSLNINTLLTATGEENEARFATALAAIKVYLAALTTVKIFVADSRSFGHQASSINILFNMIRLGCTATFTVVYENQNALNKVRVLLPIDPDNIGAITLAKPTGGTVNVDFLSFTAGQPECELALTGGYDHPVTNLTSLNAAYVIELQPFKWVQGESQNAIYDKQEATSYSLDETIANFNDHAFYIENPVNDEGFWNEFITALPSWTTKVNLTKKVLELYGDKSFFLCPMYGINTGTIDPILSLFNMCCSISYLQDQTKFVANQKAVIISFSPYSQTGQNNNVNLATLGTLITEGNYPGKGNLYSPNATCNKYLTSSSLATRVKYYNGDSPSDLGDAIGALGNNEILVVQIGPVPSPLFNYTYYMANLPFVFEGQNTAALALNLGIPYLHITTPGSYIGENLYPVLPPGSNVNTSNGGIATMISSKLSDYPGNWRSPTVRLTQSALAQNCKPALVQKFSPAYGLGKYAVETLQNNPDSNMIKYFARFGTYFHSEKNDKLVLALIALHYNIIND